MRIATAIWLSPAARRAALVILVVLGLVGLVWLAAPRVAPRLIWWQVSAFDPRYHFQANSYQQVAEKIASLEAGACQEVRVFLGSTGRRVVIYDSMGSGTDSSPSFTTNWLDAYVGSDRRFYRSYRLVQKEPGSYLIASRVDFKQPTVMPLSGWTDIGHRASYHPRAQVNATQ